MDIRSAYRWNAPEPHRHQPGWGTIGTPGGGAGCSLGEEVGGGHPGGDQAGGGGWACRRIAMSSQLSAFGEKRNHIKENLCVIYSHGMVINR